MCAKTFFLTLLSTTLAFSQVVGSALSGTVQDSTGAPISGASVVVHSSETGAERKLVSDSSGHFFAPSIAIGSYQVTASKEGFSTQSKTGINLAVGQTATLEFMLPVGEIRQVVTVQETLPTISVSTAETAGLVSERQVKELPLNGRSFDELMTLNPAVVNYTSQRSGGVGSSSSSVGNMFAVSGHRPQENLFLLNGIEYTGASSINNTPGGTSGQLLGVDAVREFNVVTDTYGAEYGKRPGAQVSIVTASGTNDLHGSLYEFIRNSDLDARNFFDQGGIPPFRRNNFGAALGGPVRKNKLFIFGNYEGYRQNLALSDVTLVPDNNARLGLLPNSSGVLAKVKVTPAAEELLSLWPLQNGPDLGGGIGISYNHPLQKIREDFGTTRLDYNLSDRDTFFSVYTIDDSDANTPSNNPLSTVFETLREQVASVQEQHVFSPTVLNTSRFGYSRAGYFFNGETPENIPGWVQGDPIGAVVIGGGTALNGASSISLAGTNATSNLDAVRNLFTYDDHVAISHGIHQIEAGVWIQRIQANDNLAQDQYGQASFTSLSTVLTGKVGTFTVVPSPTPLGWRSLETAGFVQDAIRVTSHLQLSLGLRVEGTNGWNEAHERASTYLFNSAGVIETTPQIGNSVFTVNRAKFLPEPRVGLAWDPFGKSKTVIHAGFGIYHALLDNIDYRVDAAAPFNTTQTLKNVSLAGLSFVPGAPLNSNSLVSASGIQPDAYTPTVLSWTFKIEQQIAPNTSLSIGYVGSHGYHEILSADVNEPFPSYTSSGAIYYPKGAKDANPALANTTTYLTEGVSSYNALQIDVNRRFSHGLQIRGVYTWSKNLDDGTAWNSSVAANAPAFVMFPLNPKIDYGPATDNVPHLAVLNGTYELPFGERSTGWSKKLIGGWSTSAIVTLQTGLPFTAQLGYNPTGNGDSRNPIRPSYNPDFSGPIILGGPNEYFNPAAFIEPATGTYGNVGRDTLTGPGFHTVDFSAIKKTALTERVNLQFRAEFFNIFNNVNFSTPNAVVYSAAGAAASPTAGIITATASTSRQIQFGLKLLF